MTQVFLANSIITITTLQVIFMVPLKTNSEEMNPKQSVKFLPHQILTE